MSTETLKPCKLVPAPTYAEFWSQPNASEIAAKHYYARHGAIPFSIGISLHEKTLNDGETKVSECRTSIRYPRNYPL